MPLGRDLPARAERSADAVLALLWDALSDILGAPMTATLLRRSAKRVVIRHPILAALEITRDGFEYHYKAPDDWRQPGSEAVAAVHELVQELKPMLLQLTGDVVVNRLAKIPQLQLSAEKEPAP